MPLVKNLETGVVCGVTEANHKYLLSKKDDDGKHLFADATPKPVKRTYTRKKTTAKKATTKKK